MFLQFIQGFSLLFDHITMGKGEVVDSLDCLHFILVFFTFVFLILQNLVCLDECIDLVSLILLLKHPLILHLLTLISQQVLLILAVIDLTLKLPVSLLVDLVDNLTEKVIILRSIKYNSLVEPSSLLTISEALKERIGN